MWRRVVCGALPVENRCRMIKVGCAALFLREAAAAQRLAASAFPPILFPRVR